MPQYGDPAKERLQNGRSMADLMRGGPRGLKGVVVGPSTGGGTPVNFNPHDRNTIAINVEPDGMNSQLTLGQMTAERVSQALAFANSTVTGNDIESIRERAAVAFEELAKISKSGVQRVPVKQAAFATPKPPPVPPAQSPYGDDDEITDMIAHLDAEVDELEKYGRQPNPLVKQATMPPIEKIDRSYSPMAAFGLKKQPAHMSSAQQPVITKTAQVGPPQKLLYFEKEGIGTVPAFFHEVLVNVVRQDVDTPEESGFLVLIYDLRFEQNAARWFPPSNDPYGRPWAVQISEDNRLYLVHTTGFQYVYDSREYCVLLVERAVRAQPTEA
jgi:DNA-binding transcriptional regulator YiaG